MGFFDEEENEETNFDNSPLGEFNGVSSEIKARAPDADTGLSALRDTFGTYEFEDKGKALIDFRKNSDEIRQQFGDTQPYEGQKVFDFAPVDFDQIVPEGKNEQELKANLIDKWETENLTYLNQTEELGYIQARSQLERGIKKEAALKRRELFGRDNGFITDTVMRIAQGAVAPLADAFALDSVNNYLTENTNPDVDRDHPYWAAVASGLGSVGGAVGSAAAGGPVGIGAYLGASGFGSTRKQYRDSLNNEGTQKQALTAAAIEGISQTVQAGVGLKVLGGIGKRFTNKVVADLGEKIVPAVVANGVKKSAARVIAKDVGLETAGETAGQVASNVAENIGQNKKGDLTAGLGETAFATVVTVGLASGASLAKNRRDTSKLPDENAAGDEGAEAGLPPVAPIASLKETLQQVNGAPPPAMESVSGGVGSVEVPIEGNLKAAFTSGVTVVESDGQFHAKTPDKTSEPFEGAFSLNEETGAKLDDLEHNPDGTEITLKKEGDNLVIESPYVNDDLTLSDRPTGKEEVVVPLDPAGTVVVLADETKTDAGYKVNKSFKVPGTTVLNPQTSEDSAGDKSAGAADLFGDLFNANNASQYSKSLQAKYGPQALDEKGLGIASPDGSQFYSYLQAANRSTLEGLSAAEKVLAEKGFLDSLAYLHDKDVLSIDDKNLADVMDTNLQEQLFQAKAVGASVEVREKLSRLHGEVLLQKERALKNSGQILQSEQVDAPRKRAGTQALKIHTKLEAEAQAELDDQIGKGVTEKFLKEQSDVADENVAILEAQVAEPADIEIEGLESESRGIDAKYVKEQITEPLTQAQEELEYLEEKIQEVDEVLTAQLSADELKTKQALEKTQTELAKTTEELIAAEKVAAETELPADARIKVLEAKIQELQEAARKKAVDEPIEKYTQEIESLQEQLSAANATIEAQNSAVANKVKAELDKNETELKSTEKELEVAEKTVAETESPADIRIKELDSQIEEVKQNVRTKTIDEPIAQATQAIKELKAKEAKTIAPAVKEVQDKIDSEKAVIQEELAIIQDKQKELEDEVRERFVKTAKPPTSEQSRRLSQLKKQLTQLKNDLKFNESRKVKPKQTPAIAAIRSEILSGQKVIKELKSRAKSEVQLPPAAKNAIARHTKEKSDLIQAKKEGNLKASPAERVVTEKKEKVDSLKKVLADLNKSYEEVKAKSPKDSAKIKDLEKKIDQRKSIIKDLKAKTEVALPPAAKNAVAKFSKEKSDIIQAKKEGNLKPSPAEKVVTEKKEKVESLSTLLKELDKRYGEVQKANPKEDVRIKDLEKKADQRRKIIKDLEAKKSAPRDLTPRQKQIATRKAALEGAKKEGKLPISKEAKIRLSTAKDVQRAAKERLTKAEKIIQEKLALFPESERQKLITLYEQSAKTKGFAKWLIDAGIHRLESKFIPPDNSPNFTDRAVRYYIGNLLSGVGTQIKNVVVNTFKFGGNVAGTLVTQGPRATGAYLRGAKAGFTPAWLEARDLLEGNQEGRTRFEEKIQSYDRARPLFDGISTVLIPVKVALRLMSAGDAVFHGSAVNGQAYLAEHRAATELGLKGEARRKYVEDKVFATKDKVKRIRKDIEETAKTLKSVGITMSKRDIERAVFTQAEAERSDLTRDISRRHGDDNTFTKDPTGAAGVAHEVMQLIIKSEKLGLKVGDKTYKIIKIVAPFTKVAANVANFSLDWTPIGLATAGRREIHIQASERALKKVNKEMKALETKEKNYEADKENNKPLTILESEQLKKLKERQEAYKETTINERLEHQQRLGQAIVGSFMMAAFLSYALETKDDPDALLKFYADYPKGKEDEMNAKGISRYSMSIGKLNIPLQSTGLALLPAIIATSVEAVQKGYSPGKVVLNAAMASVGSLVTQSFLKPLGDLYEVFQKSGGSSDKDSNKSEITLSNWTKNNIASVSGGWIPNAAFVKNVGRWMQASPTATYNDLSAKIFGQIPFAQDMGIGKPKLDMFGQAITSNFLERTVAGVFPISESTDSVFLWMKQSGFSMTTQGPVMKMTKPEAEKYGVVNAVKAEKEIGFDFFDKASNYADVLTVEQSREILEISGPKIKAYLAALITNPLYKKMTPEKEKELDARISAIRADAKYKVLTKKD